VWRIIPSFEFLMKRWETMAKHSDQDELKEALENGLESLHKWYGHVDNTSLAYFICVGMYSNSNLIAVQLNSSPSS